MNFFTDEQLKLMVQFYTDMGFSEKEYLLGGNIRSIFDVLNISPNVDEKNSRSLTPYEILGVLPNIVDGIEKPIVFFVKNKFKFIKPAKLSKPENFKFSKEANQKDPSIIDMVLKKYKSALAQNNVEEADKLFEILNKLTNGKAEKYIGLIYDYTKFYRQMKKQLLIDLFSHFFLIYLLEQKSIIKKGLVVKNKKFKYFNINKQVSKTSEMPQIKSIKSDDGVESFSVQNIKVEKPKTISKDSEKVVSAKVEPSISVNELPTRKLKKNVQPKVKTERKSFIKKNRKFAFRKQNGKWQQAHVSSKPKKEGKKLNTNKILREKELSYE